MNDVKVAVRASDNAVVAIASEDGLRPNVAGAEWAQLTDKTLPPLPQDVSDFITERQRLPHCFKVVNGTIVARSLAEIKADMGIA